MAIAEHSSTSQDELQAFERATQNLVGLALRSLDDVPVTLPQFRLLLVLARAGRATSGDCAKALGVGNSSITRLADRLNAAGHLVRGSDPSHRSVVTLELTDSGRAIVENVTEHRRRDLRQALDKLPAAERAACAAALDTLHQLVGRGDSAPWPAHLPL